MGLGNWFRRLFGNRGKSETVPFLDVENGRVVRIPASELRPGVIQVKVQGVDEPVWALPEQLKQGEVRHPPFEEDIRQYIRDIQEAFAEHRPISFEEWEDGFRRDANPAREIALWSHAADIYRAFAGQEATSPDRRKDIYLVIVTCLTSTPDSVWKVLRPAVLSKAEAETIVNRFYGKER